MSRQGFVYFIACSETLRVKIGFTSSDPHERMRTLQTGSPTKLIMVACHRGDESLERDLHEQYAEHRLHGEWFNMCEDLFEHVSMAVWLTAAECKEDGRPIPNWVRVGLENMHESNPLPPDMVELIA